MTASLRIGCPVWACADWRGHLYTRGAERKDYLAQYSQVFAAVEGNSTFYALPSSAAVARWRDETPTHFRFCFKFPSEITHRLMLRDARAESHAFLKLMAPLGERLGPFMLQLGPRFGVAQLDRLRTYLRELPNQFQYAVEVRHPDYFDQGANEAALHEVLREHGVDRCLFDTRCVHAGAARDRSTTQAQSRKPELPLRAVAIGERPMVRFVGQNRAPAAEPWLDVWVDTLTEWLTAGREAYFFAHTPDDREAPELARRVHQRLRQRLPQLPALAEFPGERETAARPPTAGQLSLF
jgi:uncharacterized protein YecE (DUF72 family)